MRQWIKVFSFCTLFFMMFGCEKVVEFKIDDITPKVVVTAKPMLDSVVSVQLRYSRFFLSERNFQNIDNAQIRMLLNGNAVSILTAKEGCYVFDCRPKAGDSLVLQVEVPSYTPICAATRMPKKPSVEAELFVDTSHHYYYTCQLKVNIQDFSEANYYQLSVDGWQWYLQGYNDTVYEIVKQPLSTSDVVFTDVSSIDYLLDGGETEVYQNEFLFSDELFNGRTYTIVFNFSLYDEVCDFNRFPLYLNVSSLSKDLYKYQRTKEAANENIDFLSEPVQIYSNIDGGIGIFAASSKEKVKLTPIYK